MSDQAVARQFLADRLARNQSVVLIAQSPEGMAIGFAQLFTSFSSARAAPIYVLNDLFVAPVARPHGVSTLLLKSAAETGRAAWAIRLELSTAITNSSVQTLYAVWVWNRDKEFKLYSLSL